MILLFDNYDSFTYNLLDLIKQLNLEVKVVRNDEYTLEEIIQFNPQAILISPGPGRPEQSGILMQLIDYYVDKVPMLGVCLGHQAIALHYGAKLVRALKPMHGKTSLLKHYNHPMFNNVPNDAEMMRYHSLVVESLPEELIATAHTEDQELMAFAHQNKLIWAVQFHPESIMSENGPQIIRNWLAHFQTIKDFSAFC